MDVIHAEFLWQADYNTKLKDVVRNVVIDTRKLTEYALNPDTPVGTDKALMFRLHLGFTRDNYEDL